MRLTTGIFTALLTLALSLAAAPPVHAGDPPPGASSADVAAFRNFELNESFLRKYFAVGKDIAKDPCRLGMMDMLTDKNQATSLDAAAARYDAKPGVHEMLANHGITARQMMLGMFTLLGAAMQDISRKHPDLVSSNGMKISEANMAFYRAHKSDIRQHAQSLGRMRMAASGGKMPECMTGS